MSLERAALLAAVGLSLIFGVRAAGTVVPDLFATTTLAASAVALQLLGGLAMAIFLWVFQRQDLVRRHGRLERTARIALVGALLGFAPEVQGVMRISGIGSECRFARSESVRALAPWLAAATLLALLMVLRGVARRIGRRDLARTASIGLLGALTYLLVASASLGLTLLAATGAHSPVIPQILWAAAPLAACGFGALLYFFVALRRLPEAWNRG